jgi:hypothetical protein
VCVCVRESGNEGDDEIRPENLVTTASTFSRYTVHSMSSVPSGHLTP